MLRANKNKMERFSSIREAGYCEDLPALELGALEAICMQWALTSTRTVDAPEPGKRGRGGRIVEAVMVSALATMT